MTFRDVIDRIIIGFFIAVVIIWMAYMAGLLDGLFMMKGAG